ncbi:permease-like cell division protein FtsX [Herbiconiux ginsengi]|uniref:Cell division protein FtsX n=1 Tax=Herbiconiux ginsengi TaxID=381665 RepID=A0A1H3Q6B3_9MICO|nr:permease-like cell division protein FtsX [Herbiconiux ginsengi]SDZ08800.1 cell division protein FtsX [Herbiconiux ginsengi]
MRFALILGEVGTGLRRNVSMVISVVLVTFISLTFVGAAVLMQFQINQMKSFWYDKAQVAIYMCTATDTGQNCAGGEANEDQKAAVKAQLDSPTLQPFIKQYFFEDHDEAYANFQKQFADNPVTEYVTPDLLAETYWVNMKDPQQSDVLVESLSGLPGVQSVTDQRSYLEQIFNILNIASITALGIAIIMLVAAVLLIATTIRLSAFSRRREIGIMRLVGASNRFIQTPFIVEGVIASLIGSVLAGAALVLVVKFFVQDQLAVALPFTSFIGLSDAFFVVPILIVGGALLAALAAKVAITRYLKV